MRNPAFRVEKKTLGKKKDRSKKSQKREKHKTNLYPRIKEIYGGGAKKGKKKLGGKKKAQRPQRE